MLDRLCARQAQNKSWSLRMGEENPQKISARQ